MDQKGRSLSIVLEHHHPLAPESDEVDTVLQFDVHSFSQPIIVETMMKIPSHESQIPVTIRIKYLKVVVLQWVDSREEKPWYHLVRFEVRIPSNFQDNGTRETERTFVLRAEIVAKLPREWRKTISSGREELHIKVFRTGPRLRVDGDSSYWVTQV